jgi:hypothetical protein
MAPQGRGLASQWSRLSLTNVAVTGHEEYLRNIEYSKDDQVVGGRRGRRYSSL